MNNQNNSSAKIAIQAARLRHHKHVGRYASAQYAVNRGIPFGLYRLACQLESMRKAGL